jgi:hypothetical protein
VGALVRLMALARATKLVGMANMSRQDGARVRRPVGAIPAGRHPVGGVKKVTFRGRLIGGLFHFPPQQV